MYTPALPFLRSVVDPSIRSVRAEPIKHSSAPAVTLRLWLERGPKDGPRSLVVKKTDPGWPGDPGGHAREARFYARLLPNLEIPQPHVYYAGLEPDSSHHLVIMEDLAGSHRFPPPQHLWDGAEIEPILRAYARLHASGAGCLAAESDRGWMLDRHEKRLFETAAGLPEMVRSLVAGDIWPEMPGLERLLDQTLRDARLLRDQPATILHNDVTPSNCGIPIGNSGDAVLLDWDMAGWGLAEMDLAYMFLGPYANHRRLDRQKALNYYWRQRLELGGRQRPADELEAIQFYADALWALWLIPVASRVAHSPYPPGSPPRRYWDAMFVVLGQRLTDLIDAL